MQRCPVITVVERMVSDNRFSNRCGLLEGRLVRRLTTCAHPRSFYCEQKEAFVPEGGQTAVLSDCKVVKLSDGLPKIG